MSLTLGKNEVRGSKANRKPSDCVADLTPVKKKKKEKESGRERLRPQGRSDGASKRAKEL